jgi:hypothetical protein
VIEIIAFHTCKKNGQEYDAPFLSKSNNQWLTQGYYFWTDSDYFAKKWGESHYRNKGDDYCVMKFNLSFERTELLDLVGNVKHKLDFLKVVRSIKKLNTIAQDSLSMKVVIEFLRGLDSENPGAWAYKAIKVEDKRDLDLVDIPVIKGADECISLGPTRQQLCVFENCYTFTEKEEVEYE